MIAAVVLAAGASSRYGVDPPKQQEFLPRVLDALSQTGVDEVVVVTGAHPLETSARVVHCSDWDRGPGASLRCGLASLVADPRSERAIATAMLVTSTTAVTRK